MIRWIIFVSILLVVDFYAFQGIKTLVKSKFVLWIYWLFSFAVMINMIYQFNSFDRSTGMSRGLMFGFALVVLSFVPKLAIATTIEVKINGTIIIKIILKNMLAGIERYDDRESKVLSSRPTPTSSPKTNPTANPMINEITT